MARLTHDMRAERRKKIAGYCREHTTADAAQKFGLAIATVRNACLEHGVTPVCGRDSVPGVASFAILRRLMEGEKQVDVARDLMVTQQRVNQISRAASQAGIELPCHRAASSV